MHGEETVSLRKNNKVVNCLIVGIGGQGVLTISDILSLAAAAAGYDVKKSEVHGMAQRGGSVNSHVRFGKHVYSPLISQQQADVLVAMEKLEALRYLHYCVPQKGILIINNEQIDPLPVTSRQMDYPNGIIKKCESRLKSVHVIKGSVAAKELGNLRLISTVMAGALSRVLEIDEDHWLTAMRERFPQKWQDINANAFLKGRKQIHL